MTQTVPTHLPAEWRDFFALTQPRVMSLVIFTGLCGLLAAPGSINPVLGFSAILCIALGAGGAAALNQWWEADIDAGMKRTAARPLPAGRMNRTDARDFGVLISAASVMIMGLAVNWLAAAILALSIFYYAVIYTIWLKPRTPQNIVIGGLFGAAPPLFGWTAVTNSVDPGGLLLVLIIFAWTPPHFWALALERKEEYADVGMPMLPVTHGEAYTRLHILLYTILLVIASVLPFVITMSGPLYLAGALALGAGFLYWAIVLMRNNNPKAPMETFRYSIIYLGALFLLMLVDHYVYLGVGVMAPIQMTPLSA